MYCEPLKVEKQSMMRNRCPICFMDIVEYNEWTHNYNPPPELSLTLG
jgi:hypothetical protein